MKKQEQKEIAKETEKETAKSKEKEKKQVIGRIILLVVGVVALVYITMTIDPQEVNSPSGEVVQGQVGNVEDLEPVATDCGSASNLVATRYQLTPVESCTSTSYAMESGEQVSYVEIEWGDSQDCIAGCFYNTVAAIVDADETVYPVDSNTYSGEEETIFGVSRVELRKNPEDYYTGLAHPLLEDPTFLEDNAPESQ